MFGLALAAHGSVGHMSHLCLSPGRAHPSRLFRIKCAAKARSSGNINNSDPEKRQAWPAAPQTRPNGETKLLVMVVGTLVKID
jgi:hypothetical protein